MKWSHFDHNPRPQRSSRNEARSTTIRDNQARQGMRSLRPQSVKTELVVVRTLAETWRNPRWSGSVWIKAQNNTRLCLGACQRMDVLLFLCSSGSVSIKAQTSTRLCLGTCHGMNVLLFLVSSGAVWIKAQNSTRLCLGAFQGMDVLLFVCSCMFESTHKIVQDCALDLAPPKQDSKMRVSPDPWIAPALPQKRPKVVLRGTYSETRILLLWNKIARCACPPIPESL